MVGTQESADVLEVLGSGQHSTGVPAVQSRAGWMAWTLVLQYLTSALILSIPFQDMVGYDTILWPLRLESGSVVDLSLSFVNNPADLALSHAEPARPNQAITCTSGQISAIGQYPFFRRYPAQPCVVARCWHRSLYQLEIFPYSSKCNESHSPAWQASTLQTKDLAG